jgi:hypothetical protein
MEIKLPIHVNLPDDWLEQIVNRLRNDPEAEWVEIVRCKDCKHNPKLEWFDCPMSHLNEKQRPETAWCWKGERRTDE